MKMSKLSVESNINCLEAESYHFIAMDRHCDSINKLQGFKVNTGPLL